MIVHLRPDYFEKDTIDGMGNNYPREYVHYSATFLYEKKGEKLPGSDELDNDEEDDDIFSVRRMFMKKVNTKNGIIKVPVGGHV